MSGGGTTKTFAIDFDSVLADTMIIWTEEDVTRPKHTNITKSQITAWDIDKVLSLSPEEVLRMFNYVWRNRWHDIPPSGPRLDEITKRIHCRGYRIPILTKREANSYICRKMARLL